MKMVRSFVAGISLTVCLAFPAVLADVPDIQRVPVTLHGVYKVKASNDPLLIVPPGSESFLDFGRGLDGGKAGGSVAISVRVNPNVKVRIFSWEFFPERSLLMIGSPFAHGSRKAVAIGAWCLRGSGECLVLTRENRRILLVRADAEDY